MIQQALAQDDGGGEQTILQEPTAIEEGREICLNEIDDDEDGFVDEQSCKYQELEMPLPG